MDYVIFSNRGDADFAEKEDLTYERLRQMSPRYVFFPFWSWKIPAQIYNNFECIIFHMAPLPYGRGGSPLQNLILRGFKKTEICALKCVEELDAGPIYLRRKNLDISRGTADQIYDRAYDIILNEMIPFIVKNNPEPIPQKGKVVTFKRAKKSDWPIERTSLSQKDYGRMWTDYEGMNR